VKLNLQAWEKIGMSPAKRLKKNQIKIQIKKFFSKPFERWERLKAIIEKQRLR